MIIDKKGLELVTAPNLKVPHGFTTRKGGVSDGPFASLNLGLSSGDTPDKVEANRQIVLQAFGKRTGQACAFHQVHSARVVEGCPSWFEFEADASITNRPDLLLIVSVADCYPLLFHDPVVGAVGAAHCGWRGTVQDIAGEVVRKMQACYASDPADIQVAIGPAISGGCYQVGPEVVQAFQEAGFPAHIYESDEEGRYRLDLLKANQWVLEQAGVLPEHVWASGHCTLMEKERFYSYRRDEGRTGRHWAVISLT